MGRVQLGEIISTRKGYAFKSKWYSKIGIPIVKVSNLTENSVDTTDLTHIPAEIAKDYESYILRTGNIVIQTVGSWPSNPESVVGKVVRVPSNTTGALLNQNAVRIDHDERIDKQYLYYLLKNYRFKDYIIGCAQGAASQASITLDAIRGFEFELPPLPIQRKIAAILTAYDDLIENNVRRVQILEEMAQAIYREWFVHFRFPGHETVRKVDSDTELGMVPEGWKVLHLSEACNSLEDGDWIETKDQGGSDYRLLQISNIGFGQFRETGNFRYITQGAFDRINCNEVVPGDILVARMPKPIGRAWLVTDMPWRMVTAVDVAIIRVNPELISMYYCVEHLNSPNILNLSRVLATGTTRPRITRRNLSKIPIVIPPVSLLRKFDA